jgi:hypothetical protein
MVSVGLDFAEYGDSPLPQLRTTSNLAYIQYTHSSVPHLVRAYDTYGFNITVTAIHGLQAVDDVI